MEADDFQDLYKLVRGNRAATIVTDARTLFMEKKIAEAYAKLLDAQKKFVESRSRTIKQDVTKQVDPKAKDAELQIKKLQRKQNKVLDAVKKFEELIPQLERLAKREQQRQAKLVPQSSQDTSSQDRLDQTSPDPATAGVSPTADLAESNEELIAESLSDDLSSSGDDMVSEAESEEAEPVDPAEIARPADISNQFIAAFQEADGETQLDLISSAFNFCEVRSESDVHGDALYYIRTSESGYLVRTPAADQICESVELVTVVDDRPIKPVSRRKFLKLGTRRKMVLLTKREPEPFQAKDEPTDSVHEDSALEGSDGDQTSSTPSNVIDMATFSQLMTAAQRSGLVSGADQIGHIRDREFQQGKYDLAFQALDSIYSRFTANANQRAGRLRREDADIASGKLKISPKNLLAKRARDRSQTQEVDRAQRRFQVVIEGLRVLMKTIA